MHRCERQETRVHDFTRRVDAITSAMKLFVESNAAVYATVLVVALPAT